jgi:hypothetical protein
MMIQSVKPWRYCSTTFLEQRFVKYILPNASLNDVVNAIVSIPAKGTNLNAIKNNEISSLSGQLGTNPMQPPLPLFHVEKQVEINDIEMGVLESGVPLPGKVPK